MLSILPQLIVNSIIAGSIYTLVALGFNLTYSTTKFFNFAHGVMAAVGAYTVFFLSKRLGFNPFVCIIIGTALAGAVASLLDICVYRPLRKRRASNMVLLVASLGVLSALQAIIAMLFTSQFQTLRVGVRPSLSIATGAITRHQLSMVALSLLVMIGLVFILKKTLFGKSVMAVGDDAEVAAIVGINTNKIITRVFFIGGAISGLVGILVGYDTGIEPTMGLPILLGGVVASIIGGIGVVYGSVVGGYLLGFVENFGIWKIQGEWKSAIAFGLLIVFLLVRPKGIMRK